MRNLFRFIFLVIICSVLAMLGCKEDGKKFYEKLLLPDEAELNQPAPEKFQIKFETSKGNFVIEVYRDWSPHGVDRLYYLAKYRFYNGVRFFRVIDGFMAQFGYHGDLKVLQVWQDLNIPDDPVKESNLRGYVSFAKGQLPNSRTVQLYINYVDNSRLDSYGFSPVGKVIEGMDVVDNLYSGYGECAPQGRGPSQQMIQQGGNEYLNKNFPNLDYIKKVRIL